MVTLIKEQWTKLISQIYNHQKKSMICLVFSPVDNFFLNFMILQYIQMNNDLKWKTEKKRLVRLEEKL